MATANSESLRGSCSCGRNNYAISYEEATAQQDFEIFFDDRTENAYLRVPISQYHSFTTAFYPDETHGSIRRTFTPLHAPTSQQIFCGLCGTHLSHWSESPATESQHLNISLATMTGRDLERLEDLGVLRPEVDDAVDRDGDANPKPASNATGPIASTAANGSGSMITRGEAGGMELDPGGKKGWGCADEEGIGRSSDGKTVVEWEVSEYTGGQKSGRWG